MNANNKNFNYMNVMQNNLIKNLLQIGRNHHISNILQALKIFNFKHLFYKYKLGFRVQNESYSLSKEIFNYILMNNNILIKSSSYANSIKQLSEFLTKDYKELGTKSNLNSHSELLNSKFYKNSNTVDII